MRPNPKFGFAYKTDLVFKEFFASLSFREILSILVKFLKLNLNMADFWPTQNMELIMVLQPIPGF